MKGHSRQMGRGMRLLIKCGLLEKFRNNMKRQKFMILKVELPRFVGAKYATREEQRNSSRRNEEAEQKQKQCQVVDGSGGESKA